MDWRGAVEKLGVEGAAVDVVGLVAALAVAALVQVTIGALTRHALHRVVRSTQTTWDDALLQAGAFHRVANALPLGVLYGCQSTLELPGIVGITVERVVNVLLVVVVARVLDALIDAAHVVYNASTKSKIRPIKGYVQVAHIFVWIAAVVIGAAAAADKSPLLFLSGIGALTAVLLLVFKDTILGLVASVQLAGNDMLRVGDWIEVQSAGADGEVIDIALHIVKVQNWDKTITTVPTYSLISAGFKNWRTMGESGGRRIKRSLVVDHASIRHLHDREIEQLRGVRLIHDYLVEKQQQVHHTNAAVPGELATVATNLARLTNIGTYRAYLLAYLRAHPMVHQSFTCMVRQLEPLPHGQPLEVYCFTNTTAWEAYETVQADIFDHALAVAGEFGLRIYQAPSSDDVRHLRSVLVGGEQRAPTEP